jgi:phosphate starvation-inducible PhoH-like protein
MRQSKRQRLQQSREQQYGEQRQQLQRSSSSSGNLQMGRIEPKTISQSRVFREFREGNHLALTGCAGTGKSLSAIFLALEAVERGDFSYLQIFRCAVPTLKEGFLPGTAEEKAAVYEAPYEAICAQIYNRSDAYKKLKEAGKIKFATTAFVRGITLTDSVVYMDEIQNSTFETISTVVTRVGENCRLVMSGDFRQKDSNVISSGIKKAIDRFNQMPSVSCIDFTPNDIVRSDFAKRWIELDYYAQENNQRQYYEQSSTGSKTRTFESA